MRLPAGAGLAGEAVRLIVHGETTGAQACHVGGCPLEGRAGRGSKSRGGRGGCYAEPRLDVEAACLQSARLRRPCSKGQAVRWVGVASSGGIHGIHPGKIDDNTNNTADYSDSQRVHG
ncbi:hypothetical protein E2562_013585 [Oryza meyeriana var. granulata]|uniref:Uncharacterized protein n=1 Tax=Oryza meyeriana var. granulata TaxID=110450 RepID=A0A6G1C5G5_9ORYZ|nr:hypothetical protein E2562_013585 [Oryza meyeriana var. granulata]